jgi:hypothetical protein
VFDYKNCVIEKVLREENYLSRLYIIKRCCFVGGRAERYLMALEKEHLGREEGIV